MASDFTVFRVTAPEDDSSSTEEHHQREQRKMERNGTGGGGGGDDSQDGGGATILLPTTIADIAKPKPKSPRGSADISNDASSLHSPSADHGKKTPKSIDERQHFVGETSNAAAAATVTAKLNSCTSSEKSTDSGVSSSSSSVCFGNVTSARGKQRGSGGTNQPNKNNFGAGHMVVVQNVKDC